ncbi:MAG: hypothetical protein HC834_11240 [Rhodospirillales bacterium]|nr:hypothetical protein [Rhodospirillales bacterium]
MALHMAPQRFEQARFKTPSAFTEEKRSLFRLNRVAAKVHDSLERSD